jgi:release factor glutamine methyltransferase
MIDHRVLEPRPESETIVELLKKLPLSDMPKLADIGTGSGMLAITAKLELPKAKVIATDIDQNCLDIAAQNAQKHGTKIAFRQGDLLEPLKDEPFDALLCNLPYVPDNFQINPAAMREPRLAIFGGPDGLGLYRKLFTQLESRHHKPRYVLTESLPPQHHLLAEIARKHGYALDTKDDFIQIFVP